MHPPGRVRWSRPPGRVRWSRPPGHVRWSRPPGHVRWSRPLVASAGRADGSSRGRFRPFGRFGVGFRRLFFLGTQIFRGRAHPDVWFVVGCLVCGDPRILLPNSRSCCGRFMAEAPARRTPAGSGGHRGGTQSPSRPGPAPGLPGIAPAPSMHLPCARTAPRRRELASRVTPGAVRDAPGAVRGAECGSVWAERRARSYRQAHGRAATSIAIERPRRLGTCPDRPRPDPRPDPR